MQFVLVYLQLFQRNSFLICVPQYKIRGSRSFKVIDLYRAEKPVTSDCYDRQHVSSYLQPFLR